MDQGLGLGDPSMSTEVLGLALVNLGLGVEELGRGIKL